MGKLLAACRWLVVYSTKPLPILCTNFLCPSNYPSQYNQFKGTRRDVKHQINKCTTHEHKQYYTCVMNGYKIVVIICLFIWFLGHFQHRTDHITMGTFVGRGNQYIQLVKVLYCKLPTIGKQLPTFLHKVRALNPRPQSRKVSVFPLCNHGRCNLPLLQIYFFCICQSKNFLIVPTNR